MDEVGVSKPSIGVIGAGIQGICTSLHLINKGFKVTIIDRAVSYTHLTLPTKA